MDHDKFSIPFLLLLFLFFFKDQSLFSLNCLKFTINSWTPQSTSSISTQLFCVSSLDAWTPPCSPLIDCGQRCLFHNLSLDCFHGNITNKIGRFANTVVHSSSYFKDIGQLWMPPMSREIFEKRNRPVHCFCCLYRYNAPIPNNHFWIILCLLTLNCFTVKY